MLELIAWAVATPTALALAIYSAEVLCGLRPLPTTELEPDSTKAALLVPAHNEAGSIGQTVSGLSKAIGTLDRILVVADNCSDITADEARRAGAQVVERHDPAHRGKGFALAYGREFLAIDPPAIVVIVDADCALTRGSFQQLVAWAATANQPVQAVNLLIAPDGAPSLVQISNFAMLVKNLVRARGLARIGGGIPLFGTGMAFPWSVFANVALATDNTVEDLHLALELAGKGIGVRFIENATVVSPSAGARDTISQRRRWEHGFLYTAGRQALPTALRGLRYRSRLQLALGLHLCVPPLALLIAVSLLCGLTSSVLGAWGSFQAPTIVLGCALCLALFATFLAWLRHGRGVLSVRALATAPLYVLRKVPLYLGMFSSRQRVWNRTPRAGKPD